MMGNITIKENEPFVHLHAVISDEECNAFAGHLFTATISVTCEVIINIVDTKIIRDECKDIGLFLMGLIMGREIIETNNAPKAIGVYSQAVNIDKKITFTSGQIPIDTKTGDLVSGDFVIQVNQTLKISMVFFQVKLYSK